jgi:hypothetical protein
MKLHIREEQPKHVTKSRQGKGWKLAVTGRPEFVKDILTKYAPCVRELAKAHGK